MKPPSSVANESNAARESHDLRSPVYDPLKIRPVWCILELLPVYTTFQDPQGKWHRRFGANLGRPRTIWGSAEPLVHVSVKDRMEAGIGYIPRARFLEGIKSARWTK